MKPSAGKNLSRSFFVKFCTGARSKLPMTVRSFSPLSYALSAPIRQRLFAGRRSEEVFKERRAIVVVVVVIAQ